VSESGMRTYFRDTFIESMNTQKLGGFDPYLNEYALTINDTLLPIIQECVDCGISQTTTVLAGATLNYCVELGAVVGSVVINYEVPVSSTGEFTVIATYNGTPVSSGVVTASGSISFNKNSNSITTVDISVVAVDDISISITADCPVSSLLTIIEVCVTSNADSGLFIHNEYRYTNGAYVSPLQSNLVTFTTGATNPIVSRYNVSAGFPGTGGFPPAGSTMRLASNKIGFDTFEFDTASDNFMYLRSNTLYNNVSSQIATLLSLATSVAPTAGGTGYYYGNFTVPSVGQYLYIIWDYRNSTPLGLCYSDESQYDACCLCGG